MLDAAKRLLKKEKVVVMATLPAVTWRRSILQGCTHWKQHDNLQSLHIPPEASRTLPQPFQSGKVPEWYVPFQQQLAPRDPRTTDTPASSFQTPTPTPPPPRNPPPSPLPTPRRRAQPATTLPSPAPPLPNPATATASPPSAATIPSATAPRRQNPAYAPARSRHPPPRDLP